MKPTRVSLINLLVEWTLSAAAVLLTRFFLSRALTGAAERTDLVVSALEHAEAVNGTMLYFAGGALFLMIGRSISLLRDNGIPAPLLIPSALMAAGLGLALQGGYGRPAQFFGDASLALSFARGVLVAGFVGGLTLALPGDLGALLRRAKWPILGTLFCVFFALMVAGDGPGGTHIRLFGVQPIESLKLLFVAFLAAFLGEHSEQLLEQRQRIGPRFLSIWVPRVRLLVPALLALVGLFFGLMVVKDLGPILILSLVFLSMFYLVTRSSGWVFLALGLTAAGLKMVSLKPNLVGSFVAKRVHMWTDPWNNGLANGDQVAQGLWAIAAGGVAGQGLGHGQPIPAGYNDMVLAHLIEVSGLAGLALYFGLLLILLVQSAVITGLNRTPTRLLFGAGLWLVLFSQCFVIFGGTLGLLPLTGVIAPFLSQGKMSMVVFMLIIALIARLAEGGQRVQVTSELRSLEGGVRRVALVCLITLNALAFRATDVALFNRYAVSERPIITTNYERPSSDVFRRVVARYNPRLSAIVRRIPRGEIRDRSGRILAQSQEGQRVHPFSDAIGTLLGHTDSRFYRYPWFIEAHFDARLRGYNEREESRRIWYARRPKTHCFQADQSPKCQTDEVFLLVSDAHRSRMDSQAEARALGERRFGPESALSWQLYSKALPARDYSKISPLLSLSWTKREAAVQVLIDDVARRSVTLTLDAELQRRTSRWLKEAAQQSKVNSASAVLIDVNTGEVLVRAQWPDVNLDDPAWPDALVNPSPQTLGIYGPWADKTGSRGLYQAGSVFKLATALAAIREGLVLPSSGGQCLNGGPIFSCDVRDDGGPYFTKDGWTRAIHDHHRDRMHGTPDLPTALSKSCNVYFGQLGLQLGPDAFTSLVNDGLDLGVGAFDPGPPGSRRLASTGFGQGAAVVSVSQAARLMAAVGSNGLYRRCSPFMELGAPCDERPLLPDTGSTSLILSGLHEMMRSGTGRRLTTPSGLRVYAKTGTADTSGNSDETPYGISRRSAGRPHSWLVALAERDQGPACEAKAAKRLAVAVVVPRSGSGTSVAGPVAMKLLKAAAELGYLDEDH